MKSKLTGAASLFALSLGLFVVSACSGDPPGPEQQLRAWVDAMGTAARSGDRSAIVDNISTSYADGRGNSREDIDAILRFYFLRSRHLAVIPHIEEIKVFDESAAELLLTVAMAGTNDSLLGITADAYRFELELEDRGQGWLLLSARWGELGEDLE